MPFICPQLKTIYLVLTSFLVAFCVSSNANAFDWPFATEVFQKKSRQLQKINNWDIGSALNVKARLVHTEGSFDLGKLLSLKYKLQLGADFRNYIIIPDGNYFINPAGSGHNLNYASYGVFAHISKGFLKEKLS